MYRRILMALVITLFALYCLNVQFMQGSSRGLSVFGLATPATTVAARFQLVFVVVLAIALVICALRGSFDVLRPDKLWPTVGRALAQTGQTGAIILAATQLFGSTQSAVSLFFVPLWMLGIDYGLWLAGKRRMPRRTAWVGPLLYGFATAVLLQGQGPAGDGSVLLGVLLMLFSGACTASLQFFTKSGADEHWVTATLWQNGPGAILTIPLWFVGTGAAKASIPWDEGWLAIALLAGVAFFSAVQQIALQQAMKRLPEGVSETRLNSLRGMQVLFGVVLDAVAFHQAASGHELVALAIVALAMGFGWHTNRPSKH